jgi:undecaprenyl-diphosphatase
MGEPELIALAERLGSRPFVVFAALAGVLIVALLVTIVVGRWAIRHARGIWGAAAALWSRLATQPAVQRLEARFPFVWNLMRRLTATEYLVLHLALGLALAYAAIGFVNLARAVTGEALIVRIDLTLANALHDAATPAGIEFMRAYTFLGGGIALAVIGVVVALYFVTGRNRVLAIGWVVAVLGGNLLNFALKGVFERPRPSFAEPIAVSAGWSFPSGHSMGTFVTIGMLAYLIFIGLRSSSLRILVVAAAMVWIVLMGFSRMYLGAHYLSDVLAGFAAGTVWLAGCISGVEIARRRWLGRPAPEPQP